MALKAKYKVQQQQTEMAELVIKRKLSPPDWQMQTRKLSAGKKGFCIVIIECITSKSDISASNKLKSLSRKSIIIHLESKG